MVTTRARTSSAVTAATRRSIQVTPSASSGSIGSFSSAGPWPAGRLPASSARSCRGPVQNLFLHLSIQVLLLLILHQDQHSCRAFRSPLLHRHRRRTVRSSSTSSQLAFRFIPTDEAPDDNQDPSGRPAAPPPKLVIDPNNKAAAGAATAAAPKNSDPLEGSTFVQLSVWPHVPLGCVVEECLATYSEGGGVEEALSSSSSTTQQHHHSPVYVFVSAIKSGGNADKAGLKVGDVLLECTDLFGQLTDATHLGVEKVKGLVKSRPDDEPLVFKVARGSRVLDDHEVALVELCRNPNGLGATEELMEQCVTAFVQSTYDDFDDVKTNHKVTVECPVEAGNDNADSSNGDSVDCLVDSMYSMWAEEEEKGAHESTKSTAGAAASDAESTTSASNKTVKPWSSRSSPSGTYVRDPATGQLKNIDA